MLILDEATSSVDTETELLIRDALRVLVLGCGEGWLERAVARWPFVARIDAVDFAEHAIARAGMPEVNAMTEGFLERS